jgi:hypothetical protein
MSNHRAPSFKEDASMKVTATGIQAELGNNGIVLYIADNSGKHVGKLRIGQATVEWCKGKVSIGNGKKVPLQKFIDDYLDQL